MFVDRVLFPVTALGPGNRIVMWTVGCRRMCPGCANPELWNPKPNQRIEVSKLAEIIRQTAINRHADGLTISGGEPFDQSAELLQLLKNMSDLNLDTLVFSGYRIEELRKRKETSEVLEYIDVLIDGEYIREQNDGKSTLRGSQNQRINYLSGKNRAAYEEYLLAGRQIQNFVYGDVILSVGIHTEDEKKG